MREVLCMPCRSSAKVHPLLCAHFGEHLVTEENVLLAGCAPRDGGAVDPERLLCLYQTVHVLVKAHVRQRLLHRRRRRQPVGLVVVEARVDVSRLAEGLEGCTEVFLLLFGDGRAVLRHIGGGGGVGPLIEGEVAEVCVALDAKALGKNARGVAEAADDEGLCVLHEFNCVVERSPAHVCLGESEVCHTEVRVRCCSLQGSLLFLEGAVEVCHSGVAVLERRGELHCLLEELQIHARVLAHGLLLLLVRLHSLNPMHCLCSLSIVDELAQLCLHCLVRLCVDRRNHSLCPCSKCEWRHSPCLLLEDGCRLSKECPRLARLGTHHLQLGQLHDAVGLLHPRALATLCALLGNLRSSLSLSDVVVELHTDHQHPLCHLELLLRHVTVGHSSEQEHMRHTRRSLELLCHALGGILEQCMGRIHSVSLEQELSEEVRCQCTVLEWAEPSNCRCKVQWLLSLFPLLLLYGLLLGQQLTHCPHAESLEHAFCLLIVPLLHEDPGEEHASLHCERVRVAEELALVCECVAHPLLRRVGVLLQLLLLPLHVLHLVLVTRLPLLHRVHAFPGRQLCHFLHRFCRRCVRLHVLWHAPAREPPVHVCLLFVQPRHRILEDLCLHLRVRLIADLLDDVDVLLSLDEIQPLLVRVLLPRPREVLHLWRQRIAHPADVMPPLQPSRDGGTAPCLHPCRAPAQPALGPSRRSQAPPSHRTPCP
mmetsp:Transcript_3054/g.10674  ORF Transcript_3054/g.10674 Transcript_3054/m.10674 type:complete len:708 (-) Transcript_3054:27-2150(-)